MHFVLRGVLSADDLRSIRMSLAKADFIDGRETSSMTGKSNLQLPADASEAIGSLVVDRLEGHELFRLAAVPLRVLPPLVSKYDIGMKYPEHVDNAEMGGCRTDLAITVFLSDLDTYCGGHLAVDTGNGFRRFRLPAGDAIVYPASTLHQVEPVTGGVRLAAVTWVQSMIRDSEKRAILFDLSRALGMLGDTPVGPRLRRSYQNLMRSWIEF